MGILYEPEDWKGFIRQYDYYSLRYDKRHSNYLPMTTKTAMVLELVSALIALPDVEFKTAYEFKLVMNEMLQLISEPLADLPEIIVDYIAAWTLTGHFIHGFSVVSEDELTDMSLRLKNSVFFEFLDFNLRELLDL